jgi:transposase
VGGTHEVIPMPNWKLVNNKYIREGELYLSFDFLRTWNKEVRTLNSNKEGARYKYPDSLIKFCSAIKVVFGIAYRQEQGFLKALSRYVPIPSVISYSQIQRRVNTLGFDVVKELADSEDGQVIAIDSTGIKLYNSGEWIREKHKKRKPFLKLHIAVNTNSNQAVSLSITEDSEDDARQLIPLVEKSECYGSVSKVILDGAYDEYKIWDWLSNRSIKPVIRLRKDAIQKGLNARAKAVREKNKIGEKKWKKKHGYGQRWKAETWFSSYKRRFGEHCYSVKKENMVHEIFLKALMCNMLIR